MGVYWRFYNETLGVWNEKDIPGVGLSWVAKLTDCYDQDEIIQLVETVIHINNWSTDDEIHIVPDDYSYTQIYMKSGHFIDKLQ